MGSFLEIGHIPPCFADIKSNEKYFIYPIIDYYQECRNEDNIQSTFPYFYLIFLLSIYDRISEGCFSYSLFLINHLFFHPQIRKISTEIKNNEKIQIKNTFKQLINLV